MNSERTIGFIESGKRFRIIVKVIIHQGRLGIDIRNYFQSPEGDWRPTSRGIRMSEIAFPKFKELINQMTPEQIHEFLDPPVVEEAVL